MKPLGIKNYGSIPHLSNSKLGDGDHYISSGQEQILTIKTRDKYDEVFAFEKYDGSNVGICKVEGVIYALTRSGYEAKTSPYSQHHVFHNWVQINESIFQELLNDGERLVGEWLIQAHGLKYKIECEPIVFFDLFNINNQRSLQCELQYKLYKFDLNYPRILSKSPKSVNELLPILNERTPKISSEDDPEGIVFRVERNGKVDFLAKWVRSDFKTGQYIIGKPDEELIFNKQL